MWPSIVSTLIPFPEGLSHGNVYILTIFLSLSKLLKFVGPQVILNKTAHLELSLIHPFPENAFQWRRTMICPDVTEPCVHVSDCE